MKSVKSYINADFCFIVYLEESELAKQLHPKENDLVFLVPERLNREKKDMDRNGMQDRNGYYCGYVHKFRRTSVSKLMCHQGDGLIFCTLCFLSPVFVICQVDHLSFRILLFFYLRF